MRQNKRIRTQIENIKSYRMEVKLEENGWTKLKWPKARGGGSEVRQNKIIWNHIENCPVFSLNPEHELNSGASLKKAEEEEEGERPYLLLLPVGLTTITVPSMALGP